MNRAKKLMSLFKEDQQQLAAGREEAIEQAKANAKTFNVPYYVNDTSAGLRVEKEPIKDTSMGFRTLCKVTPKGEVEDLE